MLVFLFDKKLVICYIMVNEPALPLSGLLDMHTWQVVFFMVYNITKRKIYEVLAIIVCFLDTITPTNTFRKKLKELLVKYTNVDITAMGFPKDWLNDYFWG